MPSPAPTCPALLVCACGLCFRLDLPARPVTRKGKACLTPVGLYTVDGVATHELPLLHRALGGCPRTARLVLVQPHPTNQPCDARCFQARGADCDCSCAGRRHGLAHRLV